MSAALPDRRRVIPTWFLWVVLGVVMIGLLIYAGYRWPAYSGFGETDIIRTETITTSPSEDKEVTVTRQTQHARTVWDWIGLVGVGSAIALAGWIVARKQQERQQAATLEQAQDEALASYLDQMSELVVEHGLSKENGKEHEDPTESVIRVTLARAWTISVQKVSSSSNGEHENSVSQEDHLRRVAQARTIAILLGLDGEHKRPP